MRPSISWTGIVVTIVLFQSLFLLNGSSHSLRELKAFIVSNQDTHHRRSNATEVLKDTLVTSKKELSRELGNFNDTLTICLLTKDDSHILPEWLMYHYHVANLRTLIVMVDPTSKVYPTNIFDRFRNLLDIEILEWNDNDIMPQNRLNADGTLDADKVWEYRKQHLKPIKNKWLRNQVTRKYLNDNATEQEIQDAIKLVGVHRYRQESMATKCVNHLRETGRTWVTLQDSDEYIRIGSTDGFPYNTIPSMNEQGAIMKWINTVYSNDTQCFKMPWYRHGSSKEIPEEELLQTAPSDFDPKQFMTLRWRFHNRAEKNGKDCLHVQRANSDSFPLEKITNVHVLSDSICGSSYTSVKDHPIAIGHYTGTWEQYSRRDDLRRSNTRVDFDKKASASAIADDDNLASWFHGFIKQHGIEKTKRLLGETYLNHEPVA